MGASDTAASGVSVGLATGCRSAAKRERPSVGSHAERAVAWSFQAFRSTRNRIPRWTATPTTAFAAASKAAVGEQVPEQLPSMRSHMAHATAITGTAQRPTTSPATIAVGITSSSSHFHPAEDAADEGGPSESGFSGGPNVAWSQNGSRWTQNGEHLGDLSQGLTSRVIRSRINVGTARRRPPLGGAWPSPGPPCISTEHKPSRQAVPWRRAGHRKSITSARRSSSSARNS